MQRGNVRDLDWQARAACRGTDVELFYSAEQSDIQQALALCGRCEVRAACYRQAMADREEFGVWGGTVESQRRRIFRAEHRARRASVPAA